MACRSRCASANQNFISALLPFGVGLLVGILSAIMGVGGGFIMVPAMIYLLYRHLGGGTSLFQIIFVTANVTFLQSVQTQTVDIVLAAWFFGAVIVTVRHTHWCNAEGDNCAGCWR